MERRALLRVFRSTYFTADITLPGGQMLLVARKGKSARGESSGWLHIASATPDMRM